MRYDTVFTNGVVKSRERFLLGDKIERMADGTLAEAFRVLKESGFGGDAVADSDADVDLLIRAEERAVNAFIREYAPDDKTEAFLLADYDFHNAEALVKCRYAGASEEKTLGEEGVYTVEELKKVIDGEPCERKVDGILLKTVAAAVEDFSEGIANGFTVDCTFKRGLFEYMQKSARGKKLKEILSGRADAANVSSALRSRDFTLAEKMLVAGGKLPVSHIKELCEQPYEALKQGDFEDWIKEAVIASERAMPLTQAEKRNDDLALELLFLTRYEMIGFEPFLLYVLRRRAEIRNVRIVTVSLAAGLSPQQIRNKLRKY